jgi:hypothetical protein
VRRWKSKQESKNTGREQLTEHSLECGFSGTFFVTDIVARL